jgi:hypothetical protein
MWIGILILTGWNLVITARDSPPKLVSIDVGTVARAAAELLSETMTDEVSENSKERIAQKLRLAIQSYAENHSVIVVDSASILAGKVPDITQIILKELNQ